MRILSVDTSTMAGSIAIFEEAALLGEVNIFSKITHSRRLLTSIDLLLKGLGLQLNEIDYYAVAIGPGSFTGLRIGLSTIKGLAMAMQRKICPINTLEAMAYKVARYSTLICPMLDAGREQVYTALFRIDEGRLMKEGNEVVIEPERFLCSLKEGKAVFFGSGADLYRSLIEKFCKGQAIFPEEDHYLARSIAFLALEKIKLGEVVESSALTPLYIRPSNAELKNAKGKEERKRP